MKTANILYLAIGALTIPLLVFSCALPQPALAQDGGYQEPSERYRDEELAQMLAPIALYPDALLSQVLMASTYPIEVIEADRWVKRRPELSGEELDGALLDENWDPSIKAICHFPSILALMSERIGETTNLGNAFLAQEGEVLDMVQELRSRAQAEGNLATSSQQKVLVEQETIIIEPVTPEVIYVPSYDPFVIYGPWWYPAYPPYFWGAPGISFGVGLSYWPGPYPGFAFTNWSYVDWHDHYVYIDVHERPRYVRHDRWPENPGRWNHSPAHRRGVAYRDKATAREFGQRPNPQREFRGDARGFPDRNGQDRGAVDPKRSGASRSDPPSSRTALPSTDRARRDNPKVGPEQQSHQPIEHDIKAQPRVERAGEEQQSARERKRVETGLQLRQQTGKKEQAQPKVVVGKQQQSPAVGPVRQNREQAESRDQQRSRENLFNQIGDGEQARQASERGRVSRQGRSDDTRARSPYSRVLQKKP